MKKTLLIGAAALALAGCAAGPYYDGGYGYGPSYYDGYGYGGGPAYYYDSGPSIGLGYYYYDGDGHRHWRDGHDNNWRGNGNWDRGNYGWDGSRQSTHQLQPGPMDSRPAAQTGGNYHGEMGNEAGSGYGGGGRGYSQQ